MYSEIIKCRVCGGTELPVVMSLGELALTGVFPKTPEEMVASGPIDLVKCVASVGCGLVQLRQSYNLQSMYGMNYGYRSGLNSSMVRHLRSKIKRILEMEILQSGDVVFDIGSNDSTTLQAYPKGRFRLFGIDPTGVKFQSYYPPDIKLIPEFFSAAVVDGVLSEKKAKVITSFSMFYDLEDPVAFAREIERCLHDDGVWILEQSYLPSMLRTGSFDTICHEHLEFYGLQQIDWVCRQAGLKIIDVELNDVNGGSISIDVAKIDSSRKTNQLAIDVILKGERELSIDGLGVFARFRKRVTEAGFMVRGFLLSAKQAGHSVYALGASTKGNVLLQHFKLDRSLICAVGEVNEDKFGAYTPGTLIPIIPEDEVLALRPDYLLILPWHFREFFLNQEKFKGQRLVFPLPDFQVIEV